MNFIESNRIFPVYLQFPNDYLFNENAHTKNSTCCHYLHVNEFILESKQRKYIVVVIDLLENTKKKYDFVLFIPYARRMILRHRLQKPKMSNKMALVKIDSFDKKQVRKENNFSYQIKNVCESIERPAGWSSRLLGLGKRRT